MTHWMFCCKAVSEKVSRSMDAPLPFHHRMAVGMHLLMCRYCARFRRQLFMLRKMSRHIEDEGYSIKTTIRLSKDSKVRMKKMLRSLQ
jgi:hypothetical protein